MNKIYCSQCGLMVKNSDDGCLLCDSCLDKVIYDNIEYYEKNHLHSVVKSNGKLTFVDINGDDVDHLIEDELTIKIGRLIKKHIEQQEVEQKMEMNMSINLS